MKKRLILLLMSFVLLVSYMQAQHQSEKPSKSYFKGMGFLFPEFTYIGTLAYERDMNLHTSLELSAIFIFFEGEDINAHIKILYPGIRYYLPTENKFLRKFWIGPYLAYSHLSTSYYTGSHINGRYSNGFGGGFSFGRKTFFNKEGKVFFDMGLGLSVNTILHTDEINCTLTYEFPYYIPRIIFLIGFSN